MRQLVYIPLEDYRKLTDAPLIGHYRVWVEDYYNSDRHLTESPLCLSAVRELLLEEYGDSLGEAFKVFVASVEEVDKEQMFEINHNEAIVVSQAFLWPTDIED